MKKETITLAETPITDSTPHTVGDLAAVCKRLERKLAATRQYLTVVTDRAKRLEEAGDLLTRMVCRQDGYGTYQDEEDAVNSWCKVKEDKP
jgi:hypothetical protein